MTVYQAQRKLRKWKRPPEAPDWSEVIAFKCSTCRTDAISFTDATHITDWEFEDGRATVTIRTDLSVSVTMADAMAGIGHDGAVRIPEHSFDLERGTHRLTIPAEKFRGGYAISVATDAGTIRISSAMDSPEPVLPGEPSGADAPIAGITVFSLFVFGFPTAVYLQGRFDGGIHHEY